MKPRIRNRTKNRTQKPACEQRHEERDFPDIAFISFSPPLPTSFFSDPVSDNDTQIRYGGCVVSGADYSATPSRTKRVLETAGEC